MTKLSIFTAPHDGGPRIFKKTQMAATAAATGPEDGPVMKNSSMASAEKAYIDMRASLSQVNVSDMSNDESFKLFKSIYEKIQS